MVSVQLQLRQRLGPPVAMARFVEKPDRPIAEDFLATDLFSWNSGMFLFRPTLQCCFWPCWLARNLR